jgi:hypothetical protein
MTDPSAATNPRETAVRDVEDLEEFECKHGELCGEMYLAKTAALAITHALLAIERRLGQAGDRAERNDRVISVMEDVERRHADGEPEHGVSRHLVTVPHVPGPDETEARDAAGRRSRIEQALNTDPRRDA